MKVNFSNTKPCKVTFCNADEGMYDAPYPFDDLDVRQQAISAAIWDADTGEVYATCNWDENDIPEEDYPSWDDDVDESNYDPYAGCDMYEVEPFDFGGDF